MAYPPPWIHSSTGAPLAPPGAVTLRYRQSSLNGGPGSASGPSGWTERQPSSVASRVPLHGSGGSGGRQRSSPTGGLAYGMPFQAMIPSAISAPRTFPYAVCAMVIGTLPVYLRPVRSGA
jgi:hypothetical protein